MPNIQNIKLKKRIKVKKRFSPMLESVSQGKVTLFVINNGDLGYLKKLEKEMFGDISFNFDVKKKIGKVKKKKKLKKSRVFKNSVTFELL